MSGTGRYADDPERRLHAGYRLLAAAAVDGRIDPEDAADLEAHLLTCDACSADLAAMESDHRLLAEPASVRPADPRVRAAILDAARAPGVPRVGGPPRPWAALLAAGLVVAVVGAGVLLGSLRPTVPGAAPTSSPSAALAPPSIPPGSSDARAIDARLVGNSTGAAPEIRVTAYVVGGGDGPPEGYVQFDNPTGESWIGSITRASYFYDANGTWYVARLEGCRDGGMPPCDLYALQLIDGRDRPDRQDEISLSYLEAGDSEPEPWAWWYRLTAGDIYVDGPLPGCCDPTPPPACVPPPAGLTAWWLHDDARDGEGGHDGLLRGTAAIAPALVGDGLALDGSAGYMEVPYTADLDLGAGDFTLMLWVRFASLAGEITLLEQWRDVAEGGPPNAGWTFIRQPTNAFHFVVADGSTGLSAGTAPLPLERDRWYHVAARRQDNVIVLYVDGTLVGGNDQLPEGFDIGLERPLLFGRRGDDRGNLLHGQLDEVKLVVGEALFESDIRADYLAGPTGACSS